MRSWIHDFMAAAAFSVSPGGVSSGTVSLCDVLLVWWMSTEPRRGFLRTRGAVTASMSMLLYYPNHGFVCVTCGISSSLFSVHASLKRESLKRTPSPPGRSLACNVRAASSPADMPPPPSRRGAEAVCRDKRMHRLKGSRRRGSVLNYWPCSMKLNTVGFISWCCCCCVFYSVNQIQYNIILWKYTKQKVWKGIGRSKKCLFIPILN